MSENWRTIQQASNEIRTLPNRLIREAGLDEVQKDLKATTSDLKIDVSKDFEPAKIDPWKFDMDEWTKSPNTIAPQEIPLEESPVETPPTGTTDAPEQS